MDIINLYLRLRNLIHTMIITDSNDNKIYINENQIHTQLPNSNILRGTYYSEGLLKYFLKKRQIKNITVLSSYNLKLKNIKVIITDKPYPMKVRSGNFNINNLDEFPPLK